MTGGLALVQCYNLGGGPGCSGPLCDNAIEVFVKSVVCPSDQWVDGQWDTINCAGLRIEYEEIGCGATLFCGNDVPYVPGTVHTLWATPQHNFRVVFVDTLGNVYQPDITNDLRWGIDPSNTPAPNRCSEPPGYFRID